MTLDPKQAINIKRIGHYEILHAIGKGGMGIVYLALDARLNRHVAIKCLHTELCEPSDRERFKREALLLAKLNHPYIVHLYDVVESPEQLALVMEYVDSSNLQAHLREHIIPYSQRMKWLIQIAQGLAVAHDADIIHRDLKTENILINSRLEAKISDLGIAKYQESGATITDHAAGSYCAMSPEQAKGETLDCRSDLFSFGILMYQLLCGCHPFGSTNNKLQLIQRIISQPPISPNINNPNLPAAISDLLGQLLAKDPNQRPANTHWLVAQLEKLAQIQPKEDVISDDTLPLPPTGHNTSTNHSIKHPTFANSSTSKILQLKNTITRAHCSFIALWQNHKPSITLGVMVLLLLSAFSFWQLQPKPPKYIAVIPPKLTTSGMTEEQQALIKETVYDAIQQSILQLNNYYLIPREEIDDIDGDYETIAKATAADELVTAQLNCKIETCHIVLSRLVPNNSDSDYRMRIIKTFSSDTLTDNYLTVAQTTTNTISKTFNIDIRNIFDSIKNEDYEIFIKTKQKYISTGANHQLIENLNKLAISTKKKSIIQKLYVDIYLDLYYETGDTAHLDSAEKKISFKIASSKSDEYLHLINMFHIHIAKREYDLAQKTITEMFEHKLYKTKTTHSQAFLELEKNNYTKAAKIINNIIKIKPTANLHLDLALTNWYAGEVKNAKKNIQQVLEKSPTHYKAVRLSGAISMHEGNMDEAIKYFKLALEKSTENVADLSNIGLCYILIKEYEKAELAFKKAIELEPEQTSIKLNLADTKDLQGKKNEANKLYLEIIDLIKDNTNKENLRNKAQAFAHLKEFKKAIKTLTILQQLDPQGAETSYTSALIYALAGEKNSALIYIENALKRSINHIWFEFSWFDSLCEHTEFPELMTSYGSINRCKAHNNKN